MAITLYDLAGAEADRRFSPFCWRIRMALAHKGLEVETIAWRFTEKQAIARSGQGRVPVLVDGERWVSDSWAIANYLEDTYPDRRSLFGGAAGRALSRFYNNWADNVLNPGLMRFTLLDIFRHLDERDKDYFRRSREERFKVTLESFVADREQRVEGFRQGLAPLRLTLQTQPFLGGEAPLYADYIVFGAFQWGRCISDFAVLAADDPVAAWRQRLLGLFGGLALVLAAVGIYGVVSYAVTLRTREVGIRMALGAERRDVLAMVLRQGLGLIGLGLAAGFAASLALTRFLASLLFEVRPTDIATSAAVAVVLAAVALAASYLPAWRASKVDPMVALHYE